MGVKITNQLTIASTVIITVLIIALGYITVWTNPSNFKDYMFQYFKYDSIHIGMTREQVQSVLDVTPVVGTNEDYTYSKTFDEVLLYPTKLKTKQADYILVFYLNGKVVGKQPSSQGKIRFDRNEFMERMKKSQHQSASLLLIMIVGSVATIGWFILFSRHKIIGEGYKRSFTGVLGVFCLMISIAVVAFLCISVVMNVLATW